MYVAAFGRHAEVDVADDASTVVLAEERSGDLALQFLFADGGLMSHVDIIAKALLLRFKIVYQNAVGK